MKTLITTTQRLPSQMVRRVWKKGDRLKRTPIVLTERDKQILTAMHIHGFLTTELIELAFFPEPAEGRKSRSSRAYQRMQQLWQWSLVERLERPMARSLGGRRPYLYTLTRAGASVFAGCAEDGSALSINPRRLDRLSDVFVDHDLVTAAFWANLVALLRTTNARLGRWWPDREFRGRKIAVIDPRTDRKLPVLPDGAFEVLYPDQVRQVCLLEVDQGTLTLSRFRKKLRSFELYLESGLAKKHWKDQFEVLVLTHSRQRLNNLWRTTRESVPADRLEWYYFATFNVLKPDEFPDAQWVTAENSRFPLLYEQAYENNGSEDLGLTDIDKDQASQTQVTGSGS